MAQKVEVTLIDDIDGGKADETVRFGIDGSSYEIDVNAKHAKKIRDILSPFTSAARKVKAGSAASRKSNRPTASRERTAEIREWAKQQGKQVNDRGRIPASIVEEFEAAHK